MLNETLFLLGLMAISAKKFPADSQMNADGLPILEFNLRNLREMYLINMNFKQLIVFTTL
jgi:hypothetical protein